MHFDAVYNLRNIDSTIDGCERQQVKLEQGKLDCRQNNSTEDRVSLACMYPHHGLVVKTIIKLRFVQTTLNVATFKRLLFSVFPACMQFPRTFSGMQI